MSDITNYSSLDDYYDSLIKESIRPIENGIWVISDKEFHPFICDYIKGLSLDYSSYEKIIKYNEHHQTYNCLLPMIVSNPSHMDDVIWDEKTFNSRNIHKYIHSHDFITAEFKINTIECDSDSKKTYERFFYCDIIKTIMNYHMECIIHNKRINRLLSGFRSYTQWNELQDQLLFQNIKDEMILENIWNPIFDKPLKEYAIQTDCMGYENYLLYKYNFILRDYLYKIGYRR